MTATQRPRRRELWVLLALLALLLAAVALWLTGRPAPHRVASDAAPATLHASLTQDAFGLPPLKLPPEVLLAPERVELGRKLFFDRRLSFNGTMSCAMCHVPEEGFTSQASRLSVGIEGRNLLRNAPTLLNVAWQTLLFHDGRENSLATQAWMPILHPDEMANPSVGMVLERIRTLEDYRGRFERVFGGMVATMDTVGAALAAYEATLVAGNSRVDRWLYGSEPVALTAIEQRGYRLFVGAARCGNCHTVGERDALYADGRFHVTGAGATSQRPASYVVPLAPGVHTVVTTRDMASYSLPEVSDIGRFAITLLEADRYAFKTPSLRNVSRTAPYMHDGSLATLEAVIDFYDAGGGEVEGKSPLLMALGLGAEDKNALLAFLKALDGAALERLATTSRRQEAPPEQGGNYVGERRP